MNGWKICGLAAILLSLISALLFFSEASAVDGLRLAIRATARTSLLLFFLAFTASALAHLWPSSPTRWIRRNRRYIGVSFAISHAIHLAALVALANADPQTFWRLTNVSNIVLAGLAYVFVAAMTATSFDRAVVWLGPQRWRMLHLVGSWYIWISFATAVGKRIPQGPIYWAMFALVALALVLRVVVMQGRSRPAATTSS